MKLKNKTRLELTLDAGTATMLRSTAKRLGLVTSKGTMRGKGNVSALMRGLASGAIEVQDFEAALEAERQEVRQVRFDM